MAYRMLRFCSVVSMAVYGVVCIMPRYGIAANESVCGNTEADILANEFVCANVETDMLAN